LEKISEGTRFLLIDLGWPMIIGGFVYAVPLSIISYYITKGIVSSHRKSNARLAGMSYDEWRTQYETEH
jgi:hypothetical protein